MPELPEVEVVRLGLLSLLPGRKITAIRSSNKRLRTEIPIDDMRRLLLGCTVTALKRRAKYLIFETDSDHLVVIHLGMTGKLAVLSSDTPELKHDHVIFSLDNGKELRFNDTRRFGAVSLIRKAPEEILESTFFRNAGPEPLSSDFNADYLFRIAKGRSKPVKNFIMDSRVVAGVGNIYANESLFAAGIRPSKQIKSISRKKWSRLVDCIRSVLQSAIACGGSTINDFLSSNGEKGYFQVNFSVYGRVGEPCLSCSQPIRQKKIGGRASFYCSVCQN